MGDIRRHWESKVIIQGKSDIPHSDSESELMSVPIVGSDVGYSQQSTELNRS